MVSRHLFNGCFRIFGRSDRTPNFSIIRATARSARRTSLSILAWIILGLVAGFIGCKIVNKSGEGVLLDIVLGVVGAVVGGFLFNTLGAAGVTGLNIYSLVVAVIGAIVVLVLYHLVVRGSAR
ncbi:GlsB/YeaQ/YmgE family stress response membrane protein [Sphingomonas sp. PWP1-2]|uniref:GlsB/YeaQ/YmgE family stress response membrane protein n=1 Tax=Sphingomonas sp. PWP1-2 TaxID=2804558 RepID=UPI003CEB2F5A